MILVATPLGEGHSKIKSKADESLEAVVKASHMGEILYIQVEGFTTG